VAAVAAQRSPQRSGVNLDFLSSEGSRPLVKRWGLRLSPSTSATRYYEKKCSINWVPLLDEPAVAPGERPGYFAAEH
jgi:hypothetical protein